MRLFNKKDSKKAGLAPGSLIHVGERKIEDVRIRLINYDGHLIEEKELKSIDECLPYTEKKSVVWINVDGLHDIDTISDIGKFFGMHPLVLEDILNTEQRPKMEDFEDYLFIVLKMIHYQSGMHQVQFEQLSLILRSNIVISFQERAGDIFEPVRERLRKAKGRIRKMGSDYLIYTLMDAVVDNYFVVLEDMGERVTELEESLVTDPQPVILKSIHELKRELILLRRCIWPLRELISSLERGESDLINEKTTIFLRDVYDHTIRVIETVETYRDVVSGMMDLFLSSVSNRMNEVMKVLTSIATIFIPLTFIAGIYGMNFEYMPELGWHWGYFTALIMMLAIGVFILIWFKRKRFL
jgi:magnesium transporter